MDRGPQLSFLMTEMSQPATPPVQLSGIAWNDRLQFPKERGGGWGEIKPMADELYVMF